MRLHPCVTACIPDRELLLSTDIYGIGIILGIMGPNIAKELEELKSSINLVHENHKVTQDQVRIWLHGWNFNYGKCKNTLGFSKIIVSHLTLL